MKQTFTLNHLFSLSKKNGAAFGTDRPAIYFDGARAAAASGEAVMWIDCPQPALARPVLISVEEVKAALLAAPSLSIQDGGEGQVAANGLKLVAQDPRETLPEQTREILDLDRAAWLPIVRPFRLDGGRLGQVAAGIAEEALRACLNGVFFDFAAGALAGCSGESLHLVEDALPVVALPGARQGVVLPAAAARILAKGKGVQEVFVLQKAVAAARAVGPLLPVPANGRDIPAAPGRPRQAPGAVQAGPVPPRLVCVGVANARLRARAIDAEDYPNYRQAFDRRHGQPHALLLSAEDVTALMAVARVAGKNKTSQLMGVKSDGRRLLATHQDRIAREIGKNAARGKPFATALDAGLVIAAIRAAGQFGAAITLRYFDEEGGALYLGTQDFHSIVMAVKDAAPSSPSAAAQMQSLEDFSRALEGALGG